MGYNVCMMVTLGVQRSLLGMAVASIADDDAWCICLLLSRLALEEKLWFNNVTWFLSPALMHSGLLCVCLSVCLSEQVTITYSTLNTVVSNLHGILTLEEQIWFRNATNGHLWFA